MNVFLKSKKAYVSTVLQHPRVRHIVPNSISQSNCSGCVQYIEIYMFNHSIPYTCLHTQSQPSLP